MDTRANVYHVEDIMKILDIGRNNAYNLVKENLFPVVRIGSSIRIPKEPFMLWLNGVDNVSSEEINPE